VNHEACKVLDFKITAHTNGSDTLGVLGQWGSQLGKWNGSVECPLGAFLTLMLGRSPGHRVG
jgi:hypothetical protein